MSDEEVVALAQLLEADLLKLYGAPVLTGESLQKSLGYKTIFALRQAISRKKFPVKTFLLSNRGGKYALVKYIAHYLASNAVKEEKI